MPLAIYLQDIVKVFNIFSFSFRQISRNDGSGVVEDLA